MFSFLSVFQGKKTYITAAVMIIFAVSGLITQQLDQNQAIIIILNALGLSALRAGVASK